MSRLDIGGLGIWIGMAALAMNITAMRTGAPSQLSRKRALMISASTAGIVVCPLTVLIGIEDFTTMGSEIQWPVLDYGWPFSMASADRMSAPVGLEGIARNAAFWLLAPQIVVYFFERLWRPRN